MNILLNRLPEKVSIDEADYVIHTDFRVGIQFESMLMDEKIADKERIVKALQLYYPSVPENIPDAVDRLLWFYNCGMSQRKKNRKSSQSSEQIFSYEQDQFMIYTAFLIYYHMDLNAIDYLHWWKFKQLFQELPEEAKIKKVMMYRSMKLTSQMSQEQRLFYAEMKSMYQLNDRSEKQKALCFGDILAKGMHISHK